MLRILLALVAMLAAGVCAADPPPSNAADSYRRAFDWIEQARRPGDDGTPSDFEEAAQTIADWVASGEPATPDVRAAFDRVRPGLDLGRAAMSGSTCDFGLDRSKGFELLLPHLGSMRSLARLYGAEAALAMEDGDWQRATGSLASVARIARDAKGDGILVSSLVSAAVLNIADERIGDFEASGGLDAAAATRLLGELEAFGAVDPLDVGPAFASEAVMARASIEGLIEADPSTAGARLVQLLGGDDAADRGEALSADELRRQLDQSEVLYREIASLATSPDHAARDARVAQIMAEVAEGKHGELAKILIPAAERIFEADDRVAALLAVRLKSLRAIRDGADPASFADARPHYRTLAKMSLGVDPEAQRIIELVRLAPKLADIETRVLAERALAPMRNTLAEEFRAAAACERCRWRRNPRDFEIRFLPDEIVALRAAARMARADALLRATAPKDELRANTPTPPLTVAESLEFGLALVHHLGMDPSFSQSVVAEAIARELASDLVDARAAGLVDDASLARLAGRVAKLDRVDPFSFRAGMAADAGRWLANFHGGMRSADPSRAAAVKAMSRVPADSFALLPICEEVWVQMRSELDAGVEADEAALAAKRDGARTKALQLLAARRDAGALLGWTDLLPGDLDSIATAACQGTAEAGAKGVSLPSPPFPLGLSERMSSAGATISTLDASVEPAKPAPGQ